MTLPRAWFFCDAPYSGGAELYLKWHMEAAGQGRIGLIAVDSPGLLPWIEDRESEGHVVRRIATGSLLQRCRSTHELLRALRPELLHVNYPHPYDGLMGAAPLVARLAGVDRVLATEHIPSVGRVGKRYWFKRAFVPLVHAAITVCRAHRQIMIDTFGHGPRSVVAIPNGVPDGNPTGHIAAAIDAPFPADLAAREQRSGVRIVQVGSLHMRKGADVLVEAAAQLRETGHEFVIWLVGEGEHRPEIERAIAEAGLVDHVLLAGNREDVADILRASDIVTLASRQEGMPFSLLEGMAHGLPCVATDVDGIGEIIEPQRSGLLVPPEDPKALAAALAQLCADREMRIDWGQAARARYERDHTLSAMTRRTFALYGDLLGEESK